MYYTTSCLFFEILPDEAPEMIHKISFPHQSSLHARVSLTMPYWDWNFGNIIKNA